MNYQYVIIQIALFYSTYVFGITCYECSSGVAKDCLRESVSCNYGLFGCMKAIIYSGGIDKFGNYENQEDRVVATYRGCTVLPIGGADICQQVSLFGYRMVACYCFNDFCNATTTRQTSLLTAMLSLFTYYYFSNFVA